MNSDLASFVRLRECRQRYLNHLDFLIQCKKKKLIPRFININCKIATSHRLKKTLQRIRLIVLRSVIKDTRSKLAFVECKLYNLHLKLSKHFSPVAWNEIDHNSSLDTKNNAIKHRASQKKKLMDLFITKSQDTLEISPELTNEQKSLLSNPKVVNISNSTITPTQIATLDLGLNFSLKTTKPDHLQIVSSVEKSFRHSKVTNEQKDFLRHKISRIMLDNNHATSNLTRSESQNITSLKNIDDIVITHADKGNAIVILSSEQYQKGINDLLNTNVYSISKKSKLDSMMKEVNNAINNSTILDKAKKRSLIPTYYQPGRMYILPKIHKPTLMFRPILSSINTPTHLLAGYMAKQLATVSKLNPHSVINNNDFLTSLSQHSGDNVLMVSFDVISMFTSIPVQAALETLHDRLQILQYSDTENQAIMKLVEVCTRPPIFSINQKLYQQDHGLPMGGSLSPALCDIYLWHLEEKLDRLPVQPTFWKRYVDDVFSLINTTKENIPNILEHLNHLDRFVEFTVEIEQNNRLSFLDILLTRSQASFTTTIYRKPFSVSFPPHRRSAHSHAQKMSAFHFYVNRAHTVCSTQDLLNEELTFIKHIAIDRGFKPNFIDDMSNKILAKLQHPSSGTTLQKITPDKDENNSPFLILPQSNPCVSKIATICQKTFRPVFKPDLKIQSFLHAPKDNPTKFDKPGVYCIPCECGMAYVGQTNRAFRFRMSEHKTNIKYCRTNNSNMALHSWENDHQFQFQQSKIIKQTTDFQTLNTYETAYILNNKEQLVNDQHYPPLSTIWNGIVRLVPPLQLQEINNQD